MRRRERRGASLLRWRSLAIAAAGVLLAVPSRAQSAGGDEMTPALTRALDLEGQGRNREAVAAYRAALGPATMLPAVLGLERVCEELGWPDTVLVVVDSILRGNPRAPVQLHTVQLRTLQSSGRHAEARAAFERWAASAPRDPTPYREYARLLIEEGDAPAADTLLRRAQPRFGGAPFALEMAQLRGALGLWSSSAAAWRGVLDESPDLLQAAVFSLQPALRAQRDSVRGVLLGGPPSFSARRLYGALAMAWGAPREAWNAVRALPADTSAARVWREIGESAEQGEAWAVARDAFSAAAGIPQAVDDASLWVRAANDALLAGDGAGALALVEHAGSAAPVAVRVRALAAAGRTGEAERLARAAPAQQMPVLLREVAWGWVRHGDLSQARAALAAAPVGGDSADDAAADVRGWIALYEGDVAGARASLGRSHESTPAVVAARAYLARTTLTRARDGGDAFLRLARGDSAGAADAFVRAAEADSTAAPLLLAMAARLRLMLRDDARAVPLWEQLATRWTDAPEAPEAQLEWGRALARAGRARDARAHFEALLLTYPQSALAPQARAELDRLSGASS